MSGVESGGESVTPVRYREEGIMSPITDHQAATNPPLCRCCNMSHNSYNVYLAPCPRPAAGWWIQGVPQFTPIISAKSV